MYMSMYSVHTLYMDSIIQRISTCTCILCSCLCVCAYVHMCMHGVCVCVCVCTCACMHAHVHACVRACVRACVFEKERYSIGWKTCPHSREWPKYFYYFSLKFFSGVSIIIYGYITLECIIGVSTSCFESSQSFLMDCTCMFQSPSVPDTQFTSDWVQLQRFILKFSV